MSQPRPNNGRIIVLMSPLYPLGNQLLQYIISVQKLTASNVDCYMYKETDDVLTVFRNMYNKGYRFFIGPQNSETLESLVTFFTNRQDCIYINSSSTVYQLKMPANIIRSSVNDYTLAEYMDNYFLLNIPELLEISQNKSMYEPLSTTPVGTPAFKRMVYIYQESNYTKEFLDMLELTQDPSLNVPIVPYLITSDDLTLPDEIIALLKENPVSSPNYKESEKTLFIVNSSTPQDMLYLFNQLEFYDNYFFFCDPFFADALETQYQFRYSFFGAGNYSTVGYKLSKEIDQNQDISPVALGIVDLVLQLGQWYLRNNQKGVTMQQLISKLKNIEYLYSGNDNNWYWYVRQIYIYNAVYTTLSDEPGEYRLFKDPLVFKSTASPSQNGGVVINERYGDSYIRNGNFQELLDGYTLEANQYKKVRLNYWSSSNQGINLANMYNSEIKGYLFPQANNALIINGQEIVAITISDSQLYSKIIKNELTGKQFIVRFKGCPRGQGRKDTTLAIYLRGFYSAQTSYSEKNYVIANNYEIRSTGPSRWDICKIYFTMPFIDQKDNAGRGITDISFVLQGRARDKGWISAISDISLSEVISP